ncbi:MAG: FHA domain-containing protein [Nitrospirae bacterium]|nr:FHA domain-containing protein [Candidatus Manganitrophaceae bacterium]
MQMTCENCYTIYDLSPEKSGLAGCPYCEHISKPKKGIAAAAFGGGGFGIDPSKTMLNYAPAESKNETSAVFKMIQGKAPFLLSDKAWCLAILEGDDPGKRFLLSKPVVRIGRTEGEMIVRDPEVSRQQCVIQIYGETAIIRDLKSANGTMVNGFVIKEDFLKNRDQIRVGNTVIEISIQPKK